MKKIFYGILVVGIVGIMGYATLQNAEEVDAKPIPQDELCKQPGYFEDSFSYKENEYCSTTCVAKGYTDFPTEITTVNVDQTVNAGGQFQWEEIRINTEFECTTNIDYSKWYNDYNRLIETAKQALRKMAQEAHQYHTRDVIGPCNIRIYNGTFQTYSGTGSYPSQCNTYEKDTNSYINSISKVNEFAPNANWMSEAKRQHIFKDRKYQEEIDLQSCKGTTSTGGQGGGCESGYKHPMGDDHSCCKYSSYYQYTCQTENYSESKGELIEYEKVQCGNTADTCHVVDTKYYCSQSMPVWDVNYDNYWVDVFNDAMRQLKSMGSNGLPGKLKACNESSEKRIQKIAKDPRTIVHYVDPTDNYHDAENLELETVVEQPLTMTTTQKTPAANPNVPVLNTIADGVSNNGNSSFSFTALGKTAGVRLYTQTTSATYSQYANTQVKKKATAKYKYELPDGFYQYTLKPDGNIVHKPGSTGASIANQGSISSYVDSGRYIDLGYSSYPVHYQTPTGIYPISLTYNIPGVIDGDRLYECMYRVKNRIACPEGECPDPGDETPPGDGGGDDNPPCPDGVCDDDDLYSGLNVVYRPIALSAPFHYRNGRVRESGENWTDQDIDEFILNNRGVSDDDVYNRQPIYEFTLTPAAISDIRKYNSTHEFSDFRTMTCYGKDGDGKSIGTKCKSEFIDNMKGTLKAKGSCITNRSAAGFYSCAGKKSNQDQIDVAKMLNKNGSL